jgi:hypothetical protein
MIRWCEALFPRCTPCRQRRTNAERNSRIGAYKGLDRSNTPVTKVSTKCEPSVSPASTFTDRVN